MAREIFFEEVANLGSEPRSRLVHMVTSGAIRLECGQDEHQFDNTQSLLTAVKGALQVIC